MPPRVLMLAHRLPYPPDRGDRIRSYRLLTVLSRHLDLDLACTSEEPVWLQHHQLLSTIAKRVHIQPISRLYTRARGVGAIFTGQPITPTSFFRQSMADVILQWHEQKPFDAILTFCSGMIEYARVLTDRHRDNPVRRHVLDLVDVDSAKWEAYSRHSSLPMSWVYGLESQRLRRVESGLSDHFDAITVVSPHEADTYRKFVGDHPRLAVVGNGVDTEYFHSLGEPSNDGQGPVLVFVGVLDYKPNAEGIAWFVNEVMPVARQKVPNLRLMIVGRHPTPPVLELGRHPGVQVVGSVPDVRDYLEKATAVVAPLRIARGVQNKVLEAMASQRATICSPGAAQGVEATEGEHYLLADTPEEWAAQIQRLIDHPELRRTIARAAREHVTRHYSWDDQLAPMVRLLGGEPTAQPAAA